MQVLAASFGSPVRLALAAGPRRVKVRIVAEPEQISDAALVAAIAGGDRDAFQRLFLTYAPKVKSYLLRLGAPGAIAEEMAQDAMLAVWRRAASFDAKRAAVSTWIFVIARNCWIDRLRRERTAIAYRHVAGESDEAAPEGDAAVDQSQREERVKAAMVDLSEEQRAVVKLAFFEDMTHAEIAKALATPLGTVKSRLRLAMSKLKAHLEGLA